MEAVEEIRENLACPGCEYNLRGLRGAVVICPECGLECDAAKMIAQRWTLSWFQAPGLSTVFRPVAWASINGVFVVPFVLLIEDMPNETRMITLLIIAAVWVMLMWRTHVLFNGSEGVNLALRAHAIFLGYLVAATAILGTPILAMVAAASRRVTWEGWGAVLGLVVIPGGLVLLKIGRRGEQYIGERCIRRYMNKALDE